jgi:hypothetical protein
MYCPKCGSPNDDSARFCMTCGIDMDPYRQCAQQAARDLKPDVGRGPVQIPSIAPAEVRAASSEARADLAGTHLTAGIIPSSAQNAGYGLLELGSVGLVLLWLAQMSGAYAWLTGLNNMWGDQVFMATRGPEARMMGLTFFALAVVSMILMSGLALLPRTGLELRIAGYALMLIGVAGVLIALWQGWIGDAIYVLVPLAGVVLAGAVLVQKGTSSFRQAYKTHLGARRLYRKRGLGVRSGIAVGLWALGAIGYGVLLVVLRGWTIQPGGYIGGALLVLGLIGAIAMLAGLKGRTSLWIDREGHIFEQVPS